jgi:hypothetical protein
MEALIQLGMRTTLDEGAVLSIARQIEKVGLSEGSDAGEVQQRGRALLQVLEGMTDAPPSFWSQLSLISFVPVHTVPPVPGLPWPQNSTGGVAAPRTARPETDAWLVSASMRLVSGEFSPRVAALLGWTAPPSTTALVGQLRELGRREAYEASVHPDVHAAVARLYTGLDDPAVLEGPAAEMLKLTLEGGAFVWVGGPEVRGG